MVLLMLQNHLEIMYNAKKINSTSWHDKKIAKQHASVPLKQQAKGKSDKKKTAINRSKKPWEEPSLSWLENPSSSGQNILQRFIYTASSYMINW